MTSSLHLVNPDQIQAELNRIWESLETTKTTRACLFNLIFYTENDHRKPYIQRIAQSVIQRFPARVIFISAMKGVEKDYLKTEVSILTSSTGENDVACDFIHIEAAGSAEERIPFVLLPHLLSDLPVYLVWAEDPCLKDPLLQHLSKWVNRLIFDSETADSLPSFASTLFQYSEQSRMEVADLNWARIETWRDMLSSAFYSEDRLSKIEKAKEINITYNGQATTFFCHTRIQSLYIQGWLSCQLGWKLIDAQVNGEEMLLKYQSSNSPITIRLIPSVHVNLPPGLILSLEVLSEEEDLFRFQRSLEHIHQVGMYYSSKNHCEVPCNYIFAKAESGHSLVKEICHKGTSTHFLKVLTLLKNMEVKGLC